MSWQNRLRPEIKLSSPAGTVFTAKWRGSPRSNSKRVPLFDFPGVRGTAGQDLNSAGDRYPMTIFFDGPDNDKTAKLFWDSAKLVGEWRIVHPIHGFLGLQLLSITENNEPVSSGNVTAFDLEWIELIDPKTLKTTAQLNAKLKNKLDDFNIQAASQFGKVDLSKKGFVASVTDTATTITTAINDALAPIAKLNTAINRNFTAVQSAVQDTLAAAILDPISLAAQIQQLTQLPALAVQDVQSRLAGYAALADSLFGLGADAANAEGHNTALTKELGISALIGARGLVSATGTNGLQTRAQAVEFATDLVSGLTDATGALDSDQDVFQNTNFEDQYFSQSESYSDALSLTALGVENFLVAAFDLKIEKRFVLDRNRSPMEITVTEYGTLDNDVNLDLFIQSNNLHGDQILLIPAGTEVVVYV